MQLLHSESRRSFTPLLFLVLACAFAAPGCTSLRSWSERKLAAGKLAESKELHARFRSQPGWRKKTYRNAELLAKAGSARSSAVEISLREQRGLLLVDGAIAMDFPVATGRSSHPTPKGSYKIIDKKKDYSSNLYGRIVSGTGETLVSDADTREDAVPPGASFVGSRMPYWMRITPTGVGMHVGHVPGRPASHGCIRLKKDTAVELFAILGKGSAVTVELFAPTLGGPVGLESVVTSEAAHNPRPPRPRPKPVIAPSPPPPVQEDGATGPQAPAPPSTPEVPAASPPAELPAQG